MLPAPSHPAIRIEKAEVKESDIITELSGSELFEAIDQKELIIFKKLWPDEEIKALREEIMNWSRCTELWPQGVSASKPGINFHRIDDGSVNGKLPHIFHQFGFGDLQALPESLRKRLVPIAEAMCRKRNKIAGTDMKLDGGQVRIKAIRHPRGGGHLVWHQHPYLPQKAELFLCLSQPGIDHHSGGADFRTPAGVIETGNCLEMGDLIAWRYDLSHRTQPIDPDDKLDWSGDDGFWLMAIEMVSSHERSHIDTEAETQ